MGQRGCNTHEVPGWNKSWPEDDGSCQLANKSCSSYYGKSIYGGEKQKALKEPIWKLDGDWITFYGSNLKCKGSTIWCIDHCIIKNRPLPFDLKKINPFYNIPMFTSMIYNQIFKDEFIFAKFITFFGSGSLDIIDKNIEKVIIDISNYWPNKYFRYFIRVKIEEIKVPKNAKIILSIDKDSDLGLVDWGINANAISSISIVNHRDNIPIFEYINKRIKNVIDCSKCNRDSCPTFKSNKKTITLMTYCK